MKIIRPCDPSKSSEHEPSCPKSLPNQIARLPWLHTAWGRCRGFPNSWVLLTGLYRFKGAQKGYRERQTGVSACPYDTDYRIEVSILGSPYLFWCFRLQSMLQAISFHAAQQKSHSLLGCPAERAQGCKPSCWAAKQPVNARLPC